MSSSNVLAVPAADPTEAHAFFSRKLAFETDCADVFQDLKSGTADFVLVDVRAASAYDRSHAKGAISIPHVEMNAERMAEYPSDTRFVVYCWGPGCNGATRGAMKLSSLGFHVKEMIGGMEYWENKERYPVDREA